MYKFQEMPPPRCSSAIFALQEYGEKLTRRYLQTAHCDGHGCREIISYATLTNPIMRKLLMDRTANKIDEQVEMILKGWRGEGE